MFRKTYHVVVLVSKSTDRIVSKFHDFESAKVFKRACLDLLPPDSYRGIHIVWAHTHKAPPEELSLKTGQLWCPYCRKARYFLDILDIRKCEVCYISDSEYWVVVCNPKLEDERFLREARSDRKKSRKQSSNSLISFKSSRIRNNQTDEERRERRRDRARARRERKAKFND